MPIQKITETDFGSEPSKSTNFLITQPESDSETGKEVEALRRVNAEKIADMLKKDFKVADADEVSELKGDMSTLLPPIRATSLPEASDDNYTRFCIVTTDETDRFFINLKSNGTYGWFEFKQGSIPSGNDSAILGNAIIGTLILGKEA